MRFQAEKEFEEYIRSIIKTHITKKNEDIYSLLYSKDVDIIVCKDKPKPKIFFIEVKYHKKSNGRLAFGHKEGKGFQPQILKAIPKYYLDNLRWVLASKETSGIHFLDYNKLKEYIAGNKIDAKYNNFQTRLFKEKGLTEMEFIRDLSKWIL